METELNSGRYIVFLLDSKSKQHDGLIFSRYDDAKEYAIECFEEKYANKIIIGFFSMNFNIERMTISHIESIGFKGDPKNIYQLKFINP